MASSSSSSSSTSRPKMEKFGLQTEKSAKVYLYRNGDKYHVEGVTCLVHSSKYKNMDQLKLEFSKKVGLFTGNVQKIYDMNKTRITEINQFQDNHHYICCGAESLNVEVIPKGIQDLFGKPEITESSDNHEPTPFVSSVPPKSPSKPISPSVTTSATTTTTTPTGVKRTPVVSAYKEGAVHGVDKFSVQTEKAKVIMCFRNGDKYHVQGERVTVHPTKYKTYDQLKEQLSKQLKLPTGQVRKVFTYDGKLVKAMEDIIDGEYYVCAGGEGFNQEQSPTILEHAKQHKLQQQANESKGTSKEADMS